MNSQINLKWITGLALVLFVVLGIGSFNDASDGLIQIGFPFVFIQYTGGECIGCDLIHWFKPVYMIVDLLLAVVASFVILQSARLFSSKE